MSGQARSTFEYLRVKTRKLKNSKFLTVDHFVAGTAREIKIPLQALLGLTQGLLKQYKHQNFEYIGYKEFLGIMNALEGINDQIEHCCDIICKLLYLSKKKIGSKGEDCNINEVIMGTMQFMREQFQSSNTKLSLKLAEKLPRVSIDPIELNQIIVNLTINSLQSMPTGGQVVIVTHLAKARNEVVISIKDEGVGITKEHLPRVFEPFFTTKHRGSQKSAVGLGLSIVYTIVKAYQGDIFIKSSLTQGTVVKIELPISTMRKKRLPHNRV